MEFKIAMGEMVTDHITGFRGQVTARVEYVTGCLQYLVQPGIDGQGKWVESHWLDEARLLNKENWEERYQASAVSVGFGDQAPTK